MEGKTYDAEGHTTNYPSHILIKLLPMKQTYNIYNFYHLNLKY
jgi:hypothetical protein